MPAFSSPIDCTPWVVGGLWPAELSTITDENASLAEHLRSDLQRITSRTNDELKILKRSGMDDAARSAAQTRTIDEARAHAARRVESAIRHLHARKAPARPRHPRKPAAERFAHSDLDKTQVIPAVAPGPEPEPAVEEPAASLDDAAETTVMPQLHVPPKAITEEPEPEPVVDALLPVDDDEDGAGGRHRISGDEDDDAQTAVLPEAPAVDAEPETAAIAVEPIAEDVEAQAPENQQEGPGDDAAETGAIPAAETPAAAVQTESDSERLQRLLAFVVRQEPQLNWAVGDRADGTTVLATDLAHGWVPSGITLPAGVRLLAPARRTGKAATLLGETTRSVTYTPGDRVGRAADFAATEPSVQARELLAVDDLGWELGRVTHWRDGLPRLVHTLAKAATAGTGVVEEEADLLRVHLDTARYQVLTQYPDVDPALLLNCLLLAATESSVAGDPISANYHFAWFQKLDEPPASQWTSES
jgi:hypothetical protein